MKQIILIMVIVLGFAGQSWGQDKNFVDKTQFIEYDFQTGKYQNDLKRIKVHTPVVFKITNINPFAYNVKITPKDSILSSSSFDADVLSAVKAINVQNVETKLAQEQTEANKNITNQVNPASESEYKGNSAMQKENKQIIDNSNEKVVLETQIHDLKDKLAKNESEIEKLTNNAEKIDYTDKITELNKQSTLFSNTITDYQKKYDGIKNNEQKLISYNILLNEFLDHYNLYMNDCRSVFKIIRLTKQIAWIAERPNLIHKNIKDSKIDELSKELNGYLNKIDDYRKSYTDLSNSYYKMMSMHNLDEIMQPSGVSKTLGYPLFLKTKSDQISEVLSKYQVDDIVKKTIWVANILIEEESFNIKSYPIQPENDLVQFIVEIKKRNEKDLDQYYKLKKFTYQQPIYGGTRVDFSLGLAASYYADVNVYELNKESEITTSTKDIVSPSLVGMITMSGRKTGYFAYGGSAGMGLDVTSGKIQLSNFFIGPTLLMGKRDRIFFTIGASLKNVRELKDGYNGLKVPPTNDLTSYTRDNYKVGLFASFTYSLTKDAKTMIKNLR